MYAAAVQELSSVQAALTDARQELSGRHSAAAGRIAHLETQLDTVRAQQQAALECAEQRARSAETALGALCPFVDPGSDCRHHAANIASTSVCH